MQHKLVLNMLFFHVAWNLKVHWIQPTSGHDLSTFPSDRIRTDQITQQVDVVFLCGWFYGTLPWSVVSVKSLIKTSLWCLYLQQTNVCVCVRETSHSQCACVCLEHRSAPDPMETSIWGDLCPRVPIWREFQEHSNLRLMLRYMECVRLRDNKYQCERTLSVMGFRSLVSSLGMCLQYSSDNKYIRIHIYTVYIYIFISRLIASKINVFVYII